MNKKVIKEFLNTKDDKVKEDLKPVIMKWLENEDLDEKTKEKLEAETKEEPKKEEEPNQEKPPKEEVKKEEAKPKVEEQPKQETEKEKDDELSKALELLSNLQKEVGTLKETIDKNQSFGYSRQPSKTEEDNSTESLARKMEQKR